MSELCLRCGKRDQRPDEPFCSDECADENYAIARQQLDAEQGQADD